MSSRVCTVACLGQEMEKDKADKVAARLAKKAEAAARRESAEPPSAPRTPGLLASELPVALAIPLPSPEPPMATPMTPAPITTPAPNAEGPPTPTVLKNALCGPKLRTGFQIENHDVIDHPRPISDLLNRLVTSNWCHYCEIIRDFLHFVTF